jgi:cytoskeletal protein CcmA (bactofilin family)
MFYKNSHRSKNKQMQSPNNCRIPSILSAGTTLTGDLKSEGDVHIDGTFEGDVSAKSVTVSKSGTVTGTIVADDVRIEGCVNGQIVARCVVLTPTARVSGDVQHQSIAMELGAQLRGRCQPIGQEREQSDDFAELGHHKSAISKSLDEQTKTTGASEAEETTVVSLPRSGKN